MANIKSAKKRILVNETKAARNKAIKSKVKTAVKKFGIGHHTLKKSFHITGVGHIAAPFSGDKYLFSQFFILLIDMDFVAVAGGGDSCSHAGRPAAYNYYFSHIN